jgi:tetratricopeptide (TPR) repeat protein
VLYHLVLSLFLLQPAVAPALPEQGPMDLSPEISQFLDQKVDRNLPQMERLQALVTAVFHSNDLHFVYYPATRAAEETFRERSGNCLSFTILFISMARHLGLDARFREVEIPPVWSKSGDFVNLSQHVNAAVFIGGQAFAIDVFPGVNPVEVGGQVVSDARGLAHFYNNKGVDELGKGNIQAGETYLRQALDADPTTVNVWINLGAAKARSGEPKEAEKYYRKALEIEPKNLAAMSNLANVCEVTGRAKEAQRLKDKVKEFIAKNPYHHYNLGLRAFDAGNYEEAITRYRKAIHLKAAEHNFYFALARAYGMLGQKTEAVANLQLAEKYASDAANKRRYAEKLELLKGTR